MRAWTSSLSCTWSVGEAMGPRRQPACLSAALLLMESLMALAAISVRRRVARARTASTRRFDGAGQPGALRGGRERPALPRSQMAPGDAWSRPPLVRALRALASRPWRRATPRGAGKNELNLPPYSPCNASSTRRAALKRGALSARAAHGTRKHSALARRGSSHTARAARAQQTHKGSLSQQGERRYRTRAAAPHTAENAARR